MVPAALVMPLIVPIVRRGCIVAASAVLSRAMTCNQSASIFDYNKQVHVGEESLGSSAKYVVILGGGNLRKGQKKEVIEIMQNSRRG